MEWGIINTWKPETGNRKPETGNRKPVFGLSTEWLVHNGKVLPATIVLSHSEQLDRLRLACPEAIPYAVVAGDICYDKLQASSPLRATYRRAFGLSPQQKLIVLSSTWGPDSLLGKHPHLPLLLAESLPVDEFRITLALHPNIWSGHSRWQVSEWLSSCTTSGVHIPDHVDEWQAAIVAADLLIGDHGSVPFYSAALGNPLLLATAPAHTVDPDSPIAQLMTVTPRLDLTGNLHQQILKVLDEHDPKRYSAITALTTSEPGRSAAVLRTALYRTLRLPEPAEAAELSALPLPPRALDGPDAHLVRVALGDTGSAAVTRFPAERLRTGTNVPRGASLVTGIAEPRHRWLQLADVIVGTIGQDTSHWITETLARLPGCALAIAPETPDSWLLGDHEGGRLRVEATGSVGRLFASVAYEWLARGHAFTELPGDWVVSCGGQDHRMTVIPVPPL
jgi:hypothetical protein